ncbi:hypothetical protein [Streptomyces sp. NPDC015242]|uniref:hypothetical protein n=1 Tax=Streptomyces sp. NPDC015242 TaxID=3364951 RepID=UPI0036FD2D80
MAHFAVRIPGEGLAEINGELLAVEPGRSVHEAVLDRLQQHAQERGAAVEATVNDGPGGAHFVLQVAPDGSSRLLDPTERATPTDHPSERAAPGSARPELPPGPAASGPAAPVAVPGPGASGVAVPVVAAGPAVPGPAAPVVAAAPAVPGPAASASGASAPLGVPGPGAPAAAATEAVVPVAAAGPAVPGPAAPVAPTAAVPEAAAAPTTLRPAAPGPSAPFSAAHPVAPTPAAAPVTAPASALTTAIARARAAATAPPAPAPTPVPSPSSARAATSFSAAAPAAAATPAASHAAHPAPPPPPSRPLPRHLAQRVARVNGLVAAGRLREASGEVTALREELTRTAGTEDPDALEARAMEAYLAYLRGDHREATVLALSVARVLCGAGDPQAPAAVARAAAAWQRLEDDRAAEIHGRELLHMWGRLRTGGRLTPVDERLARRVRAHVEALSSCV